MLNKLEKALGYKFRDPELLRMALTHTSCANEIYQDPLRSYERLEFLGDSIVGFVTAEYLYRTFPKKLEGDLTRIRAELVCEKSLAAVAERLSLGEHLLLGNGEDQSGGRRRPSILCDVMEAVVAASYLDGGFAVASDIVTRLILPQLAEAEKTHDYKTELLENRPDTQAIAELGRLSEARRTRPAALAGLTPRELELADLLAQRLTNREIAGRLGLSEGSVKQYLNQLYAKLHIDGDTRRKRQELAALLKQSG